MFIQKIMNFFKKIKTKLLRLFKKRNEIFYIGGSETLPSPLEKEEEQRLVALMGENVSIRDRLIEHNLRLVVYIAKRFESTGINMEDLISIGTIGLIKAVNTFKADKSIKLATYASRCIENEILMYIRKTTGQKQECSFDEPLKVDKDGNELLLSDILGSEEDSVFAALDAEEDRRTVRHALSELEKRERVIIELRYGLCGNREYTQKEVADLLGISQSYISRLEKRILEDLRIKIGGLV